jgi:hypothetical protein
MQLGRTVQLRHTPSLAGKMSTVAAATGTQIVGRSGGDLVTLSLSIAMEAVFAWAVITIAPAEPFAWLTLMIPVALFVLTRRSPHGEQLTDFLEQLLEADHLPVRCGDPLAKA